MPAILRVDTVGNDMLDIELDNGNTILLSTDLLLTKPEFAPLKEDDRILYPHTDGECIYWHHGPRIALKDAIALLGEPPTANKPEWRPVRCE